MRKILFMAFATALALPGFAQETYENAKVATDDLNGTARYVGMGGAMDALGADISTIGTNPAGIGLFRRSSLSLSFGAVSQSGDVGSVNGDRTNVSFDQIGFVYSRRSSELSYLNVAFNYHKSKNFDYLLSARGDFGGKASQNALSFIKAIGENDADGFTIMNIDETSRGLRGSAYYTSQLDNLYYNNFIIDQNGTPGYNFAKGYLLNRKHTGYTGEYDFNVSGNWNDRVYWGLTFGLKDINYRASSEYTEALVDASNRSIGDITISDVRKVDGTGANVKLGIIVRPVEESPFRVGFSIHTPTWYDMTTRNETYLINHTDVKGYNQKNGSSEVYDYKLFTPWNFGLSLGHTVGNYLAIGAGYEYADYGYLNSRVIDEDYYYDSFWGDYSVYESSYQESDMKHHTKRTLKGVSTFKLGAELKPIPELALRAGYNYVTSMYEKNGYKDGSLDSYGSNYSTSTDYINWDGINRLTLGVGYTIKKFSVDLAYQYTASNGKFYPFMDSWGEYNYLSSQGTKKTELIENYSGAPVSVSNKRHQFLVTLGYRF